MFTTRHLHPVPDPAPEHPVIRTLNWLHRLNGAVRLQKDARHFEQRAREAGNTVQAEAFRDAYEAAGRARENAR